MSTLARQQSKRLERAVENAGGVARVTKGGHVVVTGPDGIVTISVKSDWTRIIVPKLRRAGLDVEK